MRSLTDHCNPGSADPRCIGRTKGGLNAKLHAVCDDRGRPRVMLLTEGQMSDYKGAVRMFEATPPAPVLLADRGDDADWFRQALAARDSAVCIPSRKDRKAPIPHDAALYRHRHRIENMLGRLKDWRRIHTRYDRCAHTVMSAIALACIRHLPDQSMGSGAWNEAVNTGTTIVPPF